MHPRLAVVRRMAGAHSPARLALKAATDRALEGAERVSGRTRSLDELAAAGPARAVVLAGIYVDDAGLFGGVVEAARASRHDAEVVLGTMAPAPVAQLRDVTVATGLRGGKFPNLNATLAHARIRAPRWTLLVDSDVRLPARFVDRFVALAEAFDFAIAQPALSLRSYHSHAITRRRPWSVARETRFVEIGPLTAFRDDAARHLLPFDESVGMGWGLDLHWPAVAVRHGLRMGIIDATPVGHEEEPFGTNYSAAAAEREAAAWLAGRASLSRAEAQRVIARHTRVPVA